MSASRWMRSPADACTGQRTVGPWHLRLPHFRPDRTPASGDELQTEYFVPWEHAPAAIATVTALGTHIRPVLLLTEIRAVAADRLWLSPFCGRDSLAIHFSWSSGFRVGETDRGAPLGEAAVTAQGRAVQAHAMTCPARDGGGDGRATQKSEVPGIGAAAQRMRDDVVDLGQMR